LNNFLFLQPLFQPKLSNLDCFVFLILAADIYKRLLLSATKIKKIYKAGSLSG